MHEPDDYDCPFCRLQEGLHNEHNQPADVVAVTDLAWLVQGKAGVRPRPDLEELAHELADCLWRVLTLADAYDVDLAASITSTMGELEEIVDVRDAAGPETPDSWRCGLLP